MNSLLLQLMSAGANRIRIQRFVLPPAMLSQPTNPIERFWRAAKKVARQNCNSNFKSFDNNINMFLDSAAPPGEPPLLIRRNWNKSFRYIEAYSQGKDAKDVFAIVKEFSKLPRSHRKLRLDQ
ncbi:uncharacterized protein EV154DRAFT_565206 [Mucor mucedo]|uniref:uncharacterized protein n=1 Tax=Mucor mucedo TaxID=29922 RepID=UPI0022212322|nr:uncharacterized protein EV154DRAFT_565206 [Mucor mucedo]KAI7889647.1 hypothetical protein EV154DRAFT_565206 [Mucor mucedo]